MHFVSACERVHCLSNVPLAVQKYVAAVFSLSPTYTHCFSLALMPAHTSLYFLPGNLPPASIITTTVNNNPPSSWVLPVSALTRALLHSHKRVYTYLDLQWYNYGSITPGFCYSNISKQHLICGVPYTLRGNTK